MNSLKNNDHELSPEIMAFIKSEVESHLHKLVNDKIIPEIQKAISETLQAEIQKWATPAIRHDFPQDAALIQQDELPVIAEDDILPVDETSVDSLRDKTEAKIKPVLSINDIRLGLDFGTTTTAVSLRIRDEQPQALPIGRNGEKFMPSIVYFRQGNGNLSDRVLIGEDAEAMSLSDAAHVIRSIKRCLGCNGGACACKIDGQAGEKFPWCTGDGKVQASITESLSPSQVAFFIIQEALSRAIKIIKDNNNIDLTLSNIGSAPINLGCGANFNLIKRKALLETGKALGFNELNISNIVEEPILAGFAFSRFSEAPEGRSVIYDFGGGTLDIAVVDVARRDGKPFVTVLSTAGENWLGGDDIDKIVYKEFFNQITTDLNAAPDEINQHLTITDRAKLLQLAKTAKERLSSLEQFEDSLMSENLGPISLSLTRERFETILDESKLVKNSMDVMLRAIKLAFALDVAKTSDLLDVKKVVNLHLEESGTIVNRVVLVGGVTKIPFIQRGIKRIFGTENVIEEKVFEPISAVSIGAAYPKEAEHFSISSPPYGFYLEGIQMGQVKRLSLLEPYTYLDFFSKLYVNSIPSFSFSFAITDEYRSVTLKGKEVLVPDSEKIIDLDRLESGNYQFHVGLDGSLVLVDNSSKPKILGTHRYTHPLQIRIKNEKEHRKAEANKYPDIPLADEYTKLMNEN